MTTVAVRRSAGGLALLVVSALGLFALGAPVQAVGSPPVAMPDRVNLFSGQGKVVDVLANDTDADGDDLELCRLEPPKRHRQLSVELDGSDLVVLASRKALGTYTFDYFACDSATLGRGTVTVTVSEPPDVEVEVRKIPHRPGKLRVTNRSNFQAFIVWGARTSKSGEDVLDGERILVRKRSTVIAVRRTAIVWRAFATDAYFATPAIGEVRGISLRPRRKSLPPSISLEEMLWNPLWRPAFVHRVGDNAG